MPKPSRCTRSSPFTLSHESFERVLSRKLEDFRAELLSLHVQEVQQARREPPQVAMATECEAEPEYPPVANSQRANSERAGVENAALAPETHTPSRWSLSNASVSSATSARSCSRDAIKRSTSTSSISTSGALVDMSERWRSKFEVVRHREMPLQKIISIGSTDSKTSKLSVKPSFEFEGFGNFWPLVRVVILWIDLICMPLDINFGSISTTLHGGFLLFGRCFWSLDALVVVWRALRRFDSTLWEKGSEMRDVWDSLLINVAALALEWSMLLLEPEGWERWIDVGRAVRLSRLMCVEVQVDVLTLDAMVLACLPTRAAGLFCVPQRCFYTVVGAHWATCLWLRGVGGLMDTGWHLATGLLDVVDTLASMLAALLLTCVIIAQTTSYIVNSEKSSTLRLQQVINAFVRRQAIPRKMKVRMEHSQRVFTRGTLAQRFQDEGEMMKLFPDSLRRDLLAGVRDRILTGMPYFADLKRCSHGTFRDVACNAVACTLVLEREVVFTTWDVARHMYFVDDGDLRYCRSDPFSTPVRRFGRQQSPSDTSSVSTVGEVVTLTRKDWLSEPALWMDWKHKGECRALRDSIILALGGEQLCDALSECPTALWHAVKYAKRFVSSMHETADTQQIDDRVSFPISYSDLVQDMASGTNNHFAFISHYKEEAGTEASLMQAELQHLLQTDPSNPANDMLCPIFLDSENLTNLKTLTQHVQTSKNLIVLLTPNVLRRPWCLLEIVAAFESHVPIVLVRVERPGCNFEYPTDDFYASLRQGGIFGQDAEDMLNSEGVQLSDLEAVLRQVFMHIAVPFSPHRTFAVRQAELADVLNRCVP